MFANKRIKLLFSLLVLLGIAGLIWYFFSTDEVEYQPIETIEVEEEKPLVNIENIGQSVEGRAIEVYSFGEGSKNLLFVGGIHGGYEWNSVVLAYEVIDELTANPDLVPENLTISIIPNLNPDGVYAVVGKEGRFTAIEAVSSDSQAVGRFNANNVDLNRNFDCKWQPESNWRGNTVSAGSAPFSEPEAIALRDYVLKTTPVAVVFWHSQANAVYASECHEGVLPETIEVMDSYSQAAGYRSVESFDAYPVTGDAEGWLASIGIPAITVELATHESIEWAKNWAGVKALVSKYTDTELAR